MTIYNKARLEDMTVNTKLPPISDGLFDDRRPLPAHMTIAGRKKFERRKKIARLAKKLDRNAGRRQS